MFDLSFAELATVVIVALIVVGPERLPGVARTVGTLLGRARRYIADVKSEVEREIDLKEMQQLRDSIQHEAHEVKSAIHNELTNVQNESQELDKTLRSNMQSIQDSLRNAANEPPTTNTPSQSNDNEAAPQQKTAEPQKPAI